MLESQLFFISQIVPITAASSDASGTHSSSQTQLPHALSTQSSVQLQLSTFVVSGRRSIAMAHASESLRSPSARATDRMAETILTPDHEGCFPSLHDSVRRQHHSLTCRPGSRRAVSNGNSPGHLALYQQPPSPAATVADDASSELDGGGAKRS
ncbi:unnamed protein product [Protopolystoma xenopodis]|uniref:Uncharacterized protein n=1 Tax=Protopolystoma xenopodis TaxID=117903 RepID=A0A448XLB2_9PLAT|nr:unnamed protein product [Protopolystoma xenopodis]